MGLIPLVYALGLRFFRELLCPTPLRAFSTCPTTGMSPDQDRVILDLIRRLKRDLSQIILPVE
jgi:hypothetical protein